MVTAEQILEIIAESGAIKNVEVFDPEKTFKQNGIDSLDVYTILLAIEEQLGLSFSDEETDRMGSVGEVVKLINAR